MPILVLYLVDGEDDVASSELSFPNALEIPNLSPDREIYLIDVLNYVESNSILSEYLGINFAYYAEVNGSMTHLTSTASVVPVNKSTGIVRMQFVPSGSPPEHNPQLQFKQKEKQSQGQQQGQSRERSIFGLSVPKINVKSSASFDRQYNDNNNNANIFTGADLNLQSIVGDETAAAITEGVTAAKEATMATAKSLFSFAAMGLKTMVDAASTISTNTLGATNSLTVGNTRLVINRQIAEGGFGIVHLVTAVDPNAPVGSEPKQYALKQLICQSREQVVEAHRELDALLLFRDCDYIIRLLDHSSTANASSSTSGTHRQVNMLFPLYARGTAFDAVERSNPSSGSEGPPWPFPEPRALYVALCMASALQHIHSKGFTHRDVKPHNILLGAYDPSSATPMEQRVQMGKPVLMDLGSVTAAVVEVTKKSEALAVEDEAASKTSPAYRAPELTSTPYPCTVDERVDTWALGCTLYCLAYGHSPFENTKEGVLRLAILNGKYPLPPGNRNVRGETYSSGFMEVIDYMLQVDSSKRPYMGDVIDMCEQFNI